MSILADQEITYAAYKLGMIHPYFDRQVRENDGKPVISYGLGSYGYDIRIGNEFLYIDDNKKIDPKKCRNSDFLRVVTNTYELPPGHFVLASSLEYFKIPRDILGICVGKSTYARCGVIVNVTPLEPLWCGNLTIEISNTGHTPVIIYANEGIAQLIFHRAAILCGVAYEDRQGKYQGQKGVTVARMA